MKIVLGVFNDWYYKLMNKGLHYSLFDSNLANLLFGIDSILDEDEYMYLVHIKNKQGLSNAFRQHYKDSFSKSFGSIEDWNMSRLPEILLCIIYSDEILFELSDLYFPFSYEAVSFRELDFIMTNGFVDKTTFYLNCTEFDKEELLKLWEQRETINQKFI